MKTKELVSMTDYVLGLNENLSVYTKYDMICKYAEFLKTPISLKMFIPAIDKNHVCKAEMYLDGAMEESFIKNFDKETQAEIREYNKMQKYILFPGFTIMMDSLEVWYLKHSDHSLVCFNDNYSVSEINDGLFKNMTIEYMVNSNIKYYEERVIDL